MVKSVDYEIVVREFVLQWRYYVHFQENTLGKGMNPPYPPSYGLHSTTTGRCPRGEMVKAMDNRIVVREFVVQSRYYVHFRANHHHHIVLAARISLTLSHHCSLSFIALGRSSGQQPVSSHSCWMYVRAGRPAFARPCVGIHKSTSLGKGMNSLILPAMG